MRRTLRILISTLGTFDGRPFLLVAEIFPTGNLPSAIIPGVIHVSLPGFVILVDGLTQVIPGFTPQLLPGGNSYGYSVPPRLYFRKKSLGGMTQFLNISGAVLIALPVLQVAAFEIRNIGSDTALRFTDETLRNAEGAGHVRPDIFYIILDGYGRADTLSELYSHDNFQFQKRLEDKGFYVANASTTNYSQTILSLTSSLNFQHLPEMVSELNLEPSNRRPIMNMLANNRTVEFLRGRGYQFVFFLRVTGALI